MKFKLVETYNDYELDDLRDLVQEYLYDAVDELKSASLETYLGWFTEQPEEYDVDYEALKQVVTDAYIDLIDYKKIKGNKTMITSELKDYIEQHADLLDNNIDELINQCPGYLEHELELVLGKLNESFNEELLTEVQSPAQKAANKKYKNDIEKIDPTIKSSEYVVHHIDKTNRIKLTTGETIQVTDKSNCVLLPKIEGDSNVIHQAVHGALVCGGLDNYIRTLKQCEVIKQTEDNSISRVSLEDFIKNSIR